MIHAICDFCGKDCDRTATLLSMTPFQNFARYHTAQGGRWKTSNAYNRLCNTVFIVILILLIEKASIQSVISSLLMVVIIVFTIRIPRLRLIRNPS